MLSPLIFYHLTSFSSRFLASIKQTVVLLLRYFLLCWYTLHSSR
ncbi:hypothetical protein PROVRETT_08018 [Providencia rettgeri DSM 1131]|nr:hypothetical protein PROVRETT_08018 [Providencia rettgeri DSM 1131]